MPEPLRSLGQALSLTQLLWCVPICLTAHNLEEGLGVSELVRLLKGLYPWFILGARSFLALLVLLTLAVWGLALLPASGARTDLLVGVQSVLLVNAFVPHVLLSVRLRRYTPGVATAVLLVIPFSLVLFSRVLGAG